jgi:hypothetical protein
LQTEKVTLSASNRGAPLPEEFKTENTALSASNGDAPAPAEFKAENTTLPTSPATRQLRGVQSELKGSEPVATSAPSENPSPSVSGLNGSVPIRISWASLRPSPSESMLEALGPATDRVLAAVRNALELPTTFVATSANLPEAVALVVKSTAAAVPPGLIDTDLIVIAGGVMTGWNEKVEPLRFTPVTETVNVEFARTPFGLIEVITGIGTTTKLLVDNAILVPTLTVITPVVAARGTITTKLLAVAEITVAGMPPNRTVFAVGVELNP